MVNIPNIPKPMNRPPSQYKSDRMKDMPTEHVDSIYCDQCKHKDVVIAYLEEKIEVLYETLRSYINQ